ncbi:MerR family transcriptional regulator [Halomonas ventosae]|uniref:MerR family transcriptional regulator n=1 Tax=Halomonas ventosae TaxID=229007 RepID=UPI0010616BD4|nr:MerR family transcriptional regulator [Halomonas ventosae]
MRVTELARAGGVTPETVRHYTRQGLLRPRRDPRNGYQHYDEDALGLIRFIDCLRSLGVNLLEVKQILIFADQDCVSASDTYAPLVDRAPYIRLLIQELKIIAKWLDESLYEDMPCTSKLEELIKVLGSTSSTCRSPSMSHME